MRYALFSDIHGNLDAFAAVISFLRTDPPERYVFLGDAVGYGAEPNEVISSLHTLSPVCIAGNHDYAAAGMTDPGCFNPTALAAVRWTAEVLSPENISFLRSLPLVFDGDDFIAVHGSLDRPGQFGYVFGPDDALINFGLSGKKICFVGHTHYPGTFILKSGRVHFFTGEHVFLRKDSRYLINVGSVGQPRDKDRRACVCIYDSGKEMVTIHRLEYNIEAAAKKIRKAGLPPFLAERLFMGR